MNNALRFGWIGESRRIELHSLLVREVSEWSRDWWLKHAAAAIDVYPLDEWSCGDVASCAWSLDGGALEFTPQEGLAALGKYLANHDGHDRSGLAERIGKRSLQDLATRLAKRGAIAAQPLERSMSDESRRLDRGAYLATISLGAYRIDIALDHQLAALLAPARKPSPVSLTARTQALGAADVHLEVCITLGHSTFSQLDNLQVGEVLVGDAVIGTPVDVRLANADSIALAALGANSSHRTITLTHPI